MVRTSHSRPFSCYTRFLCRNISGTSGSSDRSLHENLWSRTVRTFKTPPEISLQAAAIYQKPGQIWTSRRLRIFSSIDQWSAPSALEWSEIWENASVVLVLGSVRLISLIGSFQESELEMPALSRYFITRLPTALVRDVRNCEVLFVFLI